MVKIGFEETAYSVIESNPSSVNVCVVLNGTTEREVEATVITEDLSATGQLIIKPKLLLVVVLCSP